MNVETKAKIGDVVYYLKQIKRVPCSVCGGTGNVRLGLTDYECPECNGNGTVKVSGQPKYEVGEGKVIAVQITMNLTGNRVIYRVVDNKCESARSYIGEKLYLDREAAEKQCKFMNMERILVQLQHIIIPRSFAATIPCDAKLMKRLDEWRNHRKFETEIFVDKHLNLFDGYTSYLMYRMLGITTVPVVLWTDR